MLRLAVWHLLIIFLVDSLLVEPRANNSIERDQNGHLSRTIARILDICCHLTAPGGVDRRGNSVVRSQGPEDGIQGYREA